MALGDIAQSYVAGLQAPEVNQSNAQFIDALLTRTNALFQNRLQQQNLRLQSDLALNRSKAFEQFKIEHDPFLQGGTTTGLLAGAVPLEIRHRGVTYGLPSALPFKAQEKSVGEATMRFNKLQELEPILSHFESQLAQVPVGSGLVGRGRGVGLSIASIFQATPRAQRAAAVRAQQVGLRSQVARALGEVANLSETEQRAAQQLLPNVEDNDDTRTIKMQMLREFLNEKLGAQVAQIHGGALGGAQTMQPSVNPFRRSQTLPHAAAASSAASFSDGQTAVNRATGERIVFRGGQWQRM